MSPERLKGQAYGPAADIWAVGLITLECVLGCAETLRPPTDRGSEFPYEKRATFLDFMSNVVDDPVPLPPHNIVTPRELASYGRPLSLARRAALLP